MPGEPVTGGTRRQRVIRAGGGRLSGVRYSVGYDADPTIGNSRSDSAPHMYARPEVRAGVARLAAHGLALDAWCYHPQLADVIALARAVPQATPRRRRAWLW